MDGWNYILDGTSYISDQMKRAILHEIYHQFLVDEGDKVGTLNGYIMRGGQYYSDGPDSHSYDNGWFRMDYLNNNLVFGENEVPFDGFS